MSLTRTLSNLADESQPGQGSTPAIASPTVPTRPRAGRRVVELSRPPERVVPLREILGASSDPSPLLQTTRRFAGPAGWVAATLLAIAAAGAVVSVVIPERTRADLTSFWLAGPSKAGAEQRESPVAVPAAPAPSLLTSASSSTLANLGSTATSPSAASSATTGTTAGAPTTGKTGPDGGSGQGNAGPASAAVEALGGGSGPGANSGPGSGGSPAQTTAPTFVDNSGSDDSGGSDSSGSGNSGSGNSGSDDDDVTVTTFAAAAPPPPAPAPAPAPGARPSRQLRFRQLGIRLGQLRLRLGQLGFGFVQLRFGFVQLRFGQLWIWFWGFRLGRAAPVRAATTTDRPGRPTTMVH